MVAPQVLPGRAFQATTPNSNLLFHWRSQSRDLVTVDRLSTGTLTRASAGGLTDGRGQRTANALTDVRLVGPAADNQPRWGVSTAGVPHLLLEDTRTNFLPISKPTTGWQTVTAFSTGGETTVAPDGTLVGLLTDNSSGALEQMIQDVEVASTVAIMTWFTKWNGTTYGAVHRMLLGSTADRGQVVWNFGSTGTMTITSTGAGNVISAPTHIGNNWWKTSLECTAISTGQDNQVEIDPFLTTGTTTVGGDMFISEIQVEDVASTGLFATSHIPTVSAAVTRATESLSWPYLPVPQAMTIYCSFIETGAVRVASSQVWRISNAGGGDARLLLAITAGKYAIFHDPAATVTKAAAAAPSEGDFVEIRCELHADGAVLIGQALNGGAEAVTTKSAANPLAAAWSGPLITACNPGFAKLRSLKIAAGTQTMAHMREAF